MKKNTSIIIALISFCILLISLFFNSETNLNECSSSNSHIIASKSLSEATIDNHQRSDSVTNLNNTLDQETSCPTRKSCCQTRKALLPDKSSQACQWKVLRWNNKPCVGVHVTCTPISREIINEWLSLDEDQDPKPDFYETYTDSNGCFDFPELLPNMYYVRADASGYAPGVGILDLKKERPFEFTINLSHEKIITATLVDCQSSPVEGVVFHCYLSSYHPWDQLPYDEACEIFLFSQTATTDANGSFTINQLNNSKDYTLYSEPEGYLPIQKSIFSSDNTDQRFVLRKACILEGHVLSESKKPIKDAEVYFREPQSPNVRNTPDQVDNETGRFRFVSAPEGYIQLQAIHEDYGHTLVSLDIKPDKVNYKDIILPKGVKLQITVTDDTGQPLEGIQVVVEDQDTGAFVGYKYTDKNGKIEIGGLNKNDLNIIRTYDKNNIYPCIEDSYVFDKDSKLTIQLKKRLTAQVKVLDADTKEPIPEFTISMCPYYNSNASQEVIKLRASTREFKYDKSDFSFHVGMDETFELTFFADGYIPNKIIAKLLNNNDDSFEPIEVLLKKGSTLHGYVVDAATKDPINNAAVQLYVCGWYDKKPVYPLTQCRSVTTNEDGTFTLSGVSDQRFYAKVSASGYAPSMIDSYELNLSNPAISNQILLWPAGSLYGTVTSESGGPLDQASIMLKVDGSNETITTKTQPDGKYTLNDVPPGRLDILAWNSMEEFVSCGRTKLIKTISLDPGEKRKIDFTFEGTCSIKGRCFMDGQPVDGAVIDIIDHNADTVFTVQASETGFYRINGIAPGEYSLKARSTLIGCGAEIQKPLSLKYGSKEKIDFHFKDNVVSGQVTDIEGEPIHSAEVELLTSSYQRSHLTYTNQEGSYSIFSVEEGDYFIVARATGYGEVMKGPWPLSNMQKQARKVDFTLKQGGAIRVHVLDSSDIPLANAIVLLSNDMNQGILCSDNTNNSGITVFDNLQSESLSAIAICKGHSPAGIHFIASVGEITDEEIHLTIGGSMKVEVRNANNMPVSNAQINLVDYSLLNLSAKHLTQLGLITPSNTNFLTNEKGTFSLGLLPPGNYNMQISKGKVLIRTPISIIPDQETLMQVPLK